jgi:hypothetical protein
MIVISELLDDKTYRQWFLTKPKMPTAPRLAPPWRLYVQLERGSHWRKKDCWSYAEAVKAFAQLRKRGLHDAAITCRPIAWEPPTRVVKIKGQFHTGADGVKRPVTKEIVWKVRLPAGEDHHLWCPYCRRPTVFRTFTSHHAFTGANKALMDPGAVRCTICGIRQEGLGSWARQ